MKFIITEQEKNQIKSLYEQTDVQAIKIDDITKKSLPANLIKKINKELSQNAELTKKINQMYKDILPQNPISYLQSKGLTPYVFLVPNYITGGVFPTTGLAVKIGNSPMTISLNLGTDPTDILNNIKYSRVNLRIPLR
jgi:hypothetical protein